MGKAINVSNDTHKKLSVVDCVLTVAVAVGVVVVAAAAAAAAAVVDVF